MTLCILQWGSTIRAWRRWAKANCHYHYFTQNICTNSSTRNILFLMVQRTVPTHSHPHQLITEVLLKSPLKHAPPALMTDISPKLHSWHRNLFRILRHVVGKSKRPAEAFPCCCPCLQPTGDWIKFKDAQKGEEMSWMNAFKCFPHCPQARWCLSVVQKINTWSRHVFSECLWPMQWLE